MHIFPFSPRQGTVAEKLKVVAKNVPERVRLMTETALEMKKKFITNNIGKTHEVIIENMKNEYYMAHTKNYILCYITSDKPLMQDEKVFVTLTEVFEDGAKAILTKM